VRGVGIIAMLKRLLVLVFFGGLFIVGVQFVAVLFNAWQFDDFVKDEIKFAAMRESDTEDHLVEHLMEQAQAYSLELDAKDIRVEKNDNSENGITTLAVSVTYSAPVDLYYFKSKVRRHVFATATY
jgi:hypothetical protein